MNDTPTPEALAEMIDRGASDAEAGRRFGLGPSAIRRLRRRWGIPARRNAGRRPGALRDDGGFRWGRGNLGERAIARLYGGRRYDAPAPAAKHRRDGARRLDDAEPRSRLEEHEPSPGGGR
jgi:hypothetical protein